MHDSYLKVKDKPDLVRDPSSKAILNRDLEALNKYKEERDFRLKLVRVVEESDTIKNDVAEIKQMLQKIIGKV
jgi:hypothetical protein